MGETTLQLFLTEDPKPRPKRAAKPLAAEAPERESAYAARATIDQLEKGNEMLRRELWR